MRLQQPRNFMYDWTNEDQQVVSVVNAFYQPWLNQFIIPAGILQGTYYDYQRPNYMNFGAIGSIVGHEITHGFDTNGKYYDERGKCNCSLTVCKIINCYPVTQRYVVLYLQAP